jgi:hypothetical protein
MLKKLKGQGAIEYLLILGAVLVIAAIVTMLVLGFVTKGPSQLQQQCVQAKKTAAATLSGYGTAGNTTDAVEAIKTVCSPCYTLDKYYWDSGKKPPSCTATSIPTLDYITQTPLTSTGGNNPTINVGSTTIDSNCLPNYYSCLTVSPSTA